jgi:hypothetical protein
MTRTETIVRYSTAATLAAVAGVTTHLAVHGQGSMPVATLASLGSGLALWGRFEWHEMGTRLIVLGDVAREIASTTGKLTAFVSGLYWFCFGAVLARIVWAWFGVSLLSGRGGIVEIVGWGLLVGTAMCFAKSAADWSVAFKSTGKLENEHVHGDARLATEPEGAAAASGKTKKPPRDGINLDY